MLWTDNLSSDCPAFAKPNLTRATCESLNPNSEDRMSTLVRLPIIAIPCVSWKLFPGTYSFTEFVGIVCGASPDSAFRARLNDENHGQSQDIYSGY